VFTQKLPDGGKAADKLFPAEPPVFAAGNRDELIGRAGLVERRVQQIVSKHEMFES
jgi:hypothetical protein